MKTWMKPDIKVMEVWDVLNGNPGTLGDSGTRGS